MKIKSASLNLILILIVGGIGGILFDRVLLPELSEFQFFHKIKFIGEDKNTTQIIQLTEQVIIRENEALEAAVQKVGPTVGVVLRKNQKGKILEQFSGFILTGDGFILTSGDFSEDANLYFLTKEKELPLELVKKNKELNLAILKAEDSNFSTVPFGEFEKLRLGERVFLVGAKIDTSAKVGVNQTFQNFVNQGILKSISEEALTLNFLEEKHASGSPLFNIKGEMLGINLVDKNGEIKVVPINKIREFIK